MPFSFAPSPLGANNDPAWRDQMRGIWRKNQADAANPSMKFGPAPLPATDPVFAPATTPRAVTSQPVADALAASPDPTSAMAAGYSAATRGMAPRNPYGSYPINTSADQGIMVQPPDPTAARGLDFDSMGSAQAYLNRVAPWIYGAQPPASDDPANLQWSPGQRTVW